MRDHADNVVIICSIENIDPMGVHTGDSVTVAPALTLTDAQYQELRDASKAIIRKIGVDTGGSNVQFAVNPETRRGRRHRDEPARLQELGARLQGHRLPDRQDRRPACRRLHARRDRQRHHAQDAGLLRAHARLRGRQDAALGVREVPAVGPRAHHAHEERRRGHGHRPHLQGGLPEGDALARARLAGRPAVVAAGPAQGAGHPHGRALRARAAGLPPEAHRGRGPRAHRRLAVLPQRVRRHRRAREGGPRGPAVHAGAAAAHEALRIQRQAPRRAHRPRRARDPRAAHRARRPAGVQGGRHVRRGVRGRDAVLLLDLRAGERGRARRQGACRDPRLRAQPHRPGHRVRLLLRARRAHGPRAGLRGRHGQLQPGDGEHRLRHLRPPVLRAAHLRGRRQHRRQRAAQGRHRPVRRPDAAQDRRRAGRGRHPHPGHAPGVHRPRRGPRALRRPPGATRHPAVPSTAWRRRPSRPRRSPHASATRCSCGRPTCSGAGPCRSSTARPSSSTT